MPYRDPEKRRQYRKAYNATYKEEFKDRLKITNRKWRWALKIKVLSYYSDGDIPCCNSCGEADIRVLQIDHINGGGSAHRKQIRRSRGVNFYRWLEMNGYPEGYQTLCANCNLRKRYDDESLYVGGNDA